MEKLKMENHLKLITADIKQQQQQHQNSTKKEQSIPVFSLGGVSVSNGQSANIATQILETNKTSMLKKSSNNDSAVSLSPVSSSPLPSTAQQDIVGSTYKLKALIKRNQAAILGERNFTNSSTSVSDLHSKSPDSCSVAHRGHIKLNRVSSPRLSLVSNSSTKTSSISPTQTTVNLINSTIYELKEKTNLSQSDSIDLKANLTSAMSDSFNTISFDPNKLINKSNSQATTPTNRLLPDLNGFKINTDLVTPTSLLSISNGKLNGIIQAKRRILSTIDNKLKEEKDQRLKELDFLSTIGTGTFGRVMCVRHRSTKKYFALKMMSIINIIKLKQVEHVKNEKNILESITDHPFIVKLFWTHHTDQFLYMLLEYVAGGELFSLLRQRGKFDTKTAVFYAAEILCALDYLHNLQIIYRDLKPENILLDLEGHLKITDFGFAKRIVNKTYTLCGTPEYLAPEVILSRGHDHCCDWWTLGVIIFEFLSGCPPFYDENQYRVYEKILTTKIEWPRFFDSSAKDLIKKLLVTDPMKRLGSGNCGIVNSPTAAETESAAFLNENESPHAVIVDPSREKEKTSEILAVMVSTDSKVPSPTPSQTQSLPSLPVKKPTSLLTQKQKIFNGTEEIKRHRWFISITDWNDVYERRLVPPFKPEIQFEGDTRNFEKYDTPDLSKTPHATEKQLETFINF